MPSTSKRPAAKKVVAKKVVAHTDVVTEAHSRDVMLLLNEFARAADEHDLCDEYDRLVEDITSKLTFKPPRSSTKAAVAFDMQVVVLLEDDDLQSSSSRWSDDEKELKEDFKDGLAKMSLDEMIAFIYERGAIKNWDDEDDFCFNLTERRFYVNESSD
jgi:hypothetical protein